MTLTERVETSAQLCLASPRPFHQAGSSSASLPELLLLREFSFTFLSFFSLFTFARACQKFESTFSTPPLQSVHGTASLTPFRFMHDSTFLNCTLHTLQYFSRRCRQIPLPSCICLTYIDAATISALRSENSAWRECWRRHVTLGWRWKGLNRPQQHSLQD